MAKGCWVNVGGTWIKATKVWRNVIGTWVPMIIPWIKAGGVWYQCFPSPSPQSTINWSFYTDVSAVFGIYVNGVQVVSRTSTYNSSFMVTEGDYVEVSAGTSAQDYAAYLEVTGNGISYSDFNASVSYGFTWTNAVGEMMVNSIIQSTL